MIAPQWIVSAAHCAFRPDGQGVDGMVTVTGVGDINDPSGEVIAADRLVVHPDWDTDIADWRRAAHPLALAQQRPGACGRPAGRRVHHEPGMPDAAGWGATDESATIGTELLKEA